MIASPEEFNIAVSKPRDAWGTAQGSLTMSKDLAALLDMRKTLAERSMSTEAIDRRIAAERVRLVRERFDRPGPQRASALEVTANRQAPAEQSVRVIRKSTSETSQEKQFKAPPATYFGTPRMPPKAPVRNY